MSTDDQMNIDERYKYLRRMQKRYMRADRQEQGRLLDEMELITELHRKSLVRLLHSDLARQPRRQPRGVVYGAEVQEALRVLAESTDYISAERLTPNLGWLAQQLDRHGELMVSPELLAQLDAISISTVGRVLARQRQDQPRLPRAGPQQAHQLRDIPMLRLPWDEQEPGHFEVDLVHHGGSSAAGEYVHTLQLIDVATGWSERVAVLGRGQLVMADAFRRCLARLPFPVQQIHPDNGSEFLNQHLLHFWRDLVQGVRLSRSRPYRKNDNPHVEQKNYTLVRAYLGEERLDTVAQTVALNHLYDQMWLYYNFFQPVLHLAEKTSEHRPDGTYQVHRRYDRARTPFDRLCTTAALLPAHRQQLVALRDQTNPRQLRREIQAGLERLFVLPKATPGQTEDVHQTLRPQTPAEIGADNPLRFAFNRTTIRETGPTPAPSGDGGGPSRQAETSAAYSTKLKRKERTAR